MTPNERQELETLLPWHAAGTLDPDDAARVEAALAADQELAKHFAIVREEMAETIHVNEALGSPSPRTLDKLLAAIDADPARTSRTMFGAGIGRLLAALSPQVLAWSAAIAALVIVLQAGVIATMLTGERSGPRRATFETASAPEAMPSPVPAPMTRSLAPAASAPAARGAGSHVLVRFAPEASMADITRFLDTNKASVVDGPKPGGLYRLQVSAAGKDALAGVVATMQASKVVGFVAPE
jgi:anti-sigma factor RsiW